MIKRILTLLFIVFLQNLSSGQITVQTFENQASFRAVDFFSNSNIWVSGSKGSILQSTDLGKNWINKCPVDYATFDFRGVAVLDKNTIISISAGDGAEKKPLQ